jgi:hypothetical protein
MRVSYSMTISSHVCDLSHLASHLSRPSLSVMISIWVDWDENAFLAIGVDRWSQKKKHSYLRYVQKEDLVSVMYLDAGCVDLHAH